MIPVSRTGHMNGLCDFWTVQMAEWSDYPVVCHQLSRPVSKPWRTRKVKEGNMIKSWEVHCGEGVPGPLIELLEDTEARAENWSTTPVKRNLQSMNECMICIGHKESPVC